MGSFSNDYYVKKADIYLRKIYAGVSVSMSLITKLFLCLPFPQKLTLHRRNRYYLFGKTVL